MMAANAPMMTRAGLVEGKPEVGILPTGQVAGLIGALPTVDEVVRGIVNEAEEGASVGHLHPLPWGTHPLYISF